MSQGLKNLQTSARSCAHRERMKTASSLSPPLTPKYMGLDDSGIDLEAKNNAGRLVADPQGGTSGGYRYYDEGYQGTDTQLSSY